MVFGSLVAGPGGAGAVPLLAGPTGASYNEIHPICVHSRPFAVKNGLFAPPSPVATRSSPSTPLAWQVFAPPDPKTAIFGIFIPRRGPRHSKNRIFRLFPRFQRAVIPSLSRDLGLVTQSRRWNFAENFRLRRCAPALKLTRLRPPPPIQFSHPLSILEFTRRRPTCKTPPKPSCFRLDNKGTTAFDPHELKHYFIGLTPLCLLIMDNALWHFLTFSVLVHGLKQMGPLKSSHMCAAF